MKLMNFIKQFSRDDKGSSTVEFVTLFPLAFGLVALNFDSAVLMLRYTDLEASLDKTVREVRLNGFPASNDNGLAYFKSEICNRANFIKDCENNIAVEMSPIDTSVGFSAPTDIKCINRADNSQPAVNFTPGVQNDAVYVRACVIVDRAFPNTLPVLFTTDDNGGIRLVADTAYVVEPL